MPYQRQRLPLRSGEHAGGRGRRARRRQLHRPHHSARTGGPHAATTPSADAAHPARHAHPGPSRAGGPARRLPGRLGHALRRARPARPVLPQDRHAGNDHLRGGLPGLCIPAAHAPGTAAGTTRPVRNLDHRAHRRRAGDGSGPPAGSGPPGPPTASAVTSATPIPAISVADRTWILLGYASPSAGGQFDVTLPSRNQALQLQRMLAAPS